MRAAFTNWNQRIAPVFDVARCLHVVEIDNGKIIKEFQEELRHDIPLFTVQQIKQLDVEILICGAISRPLQEMLVAQDIQVIGFISGELGEVTAAWLSGKLLNSRDFIMPGCCRRKQSCQHYLTREVYMFGQGRGRGNAGAGQGGQRGGRNKKEIATGNGPEGECLCPQCGQRTPHQPGVPCTSIKCPKCGSAMVRG